MYSTPHIARPMTSFTAGLSVHGTPDPDTNGDEIPVEESPQQGGLRDEVGTLDEEDDQALPGRVGGGLAGG
ncbi:hypothetical protein [Xanthomonas pisi]|uniref:Uncharacterized protein n=1 Tax=Xanthomonas pisi TaxID=56457 RepID=A0A2S7CW80_9XANT|nr:hypothetical protein [Xanthomonas pisi]KLD70355.1 hypothetical protein Y887_12095 [Xanthomonas pisi DSM 18956]PPU65826.1 hypothetical protein XpiCFBP4643_20035 [Xanthomonas pisi]